MENSMSKISKISQKIENVKNSNSSKSLSFSELGLSSWIVKTLNSLQIYKPTLIQQKCIPEALKGKDIIGMSETGSGKTAAFSLPVIETLVKDIYGIYSLILAPTRELAQQICSAISAFCGNFRVRTCLLIGGENILSQASILDERPHIVVGTPGRVEEVVRLYESCGYFKRIKYLIFDEADRILDIKFSLDIDLILKSCNENRQTLLFSATINEKVKKLASLAFKNRKENLFIFDACSLFSTVKNLDQYYIFMPEYVKDCYLYYLLRMFNLEKKTVIVFVSHMKKCETLCEMIKLLKIKCDSIHSTKLQKNRLETLEKFRQRDYNIMFSTDVAARGLDIPDVHAIINYDIPESTDNYVHRVGRTARAGRIGNSFSLVAPNEVKRIKKIEKDTKKKMKLYHVSEGMIEEVIYEVAEKRCMAKVNLLKKGFLERYEKRREVINESKILEKKIKSFFKKKYSSMRNMVVTTTQLKKVDEKNKKKKKKRYRRKWEKKRI